MPFEPFLSFQCFSIFILQAANFVQAVEERQGMMISCPEEIAFRLNYISKGDLRNLASEMNNNNYGDYLLSLIDENHLLNNE